MSGETPQPERRAALPYLTADLPGVGGSLKQSPEDFEVEEVPAYEPSGDGEHLFLWVEKRDVSAEQLTRHVARVLGLPPREVGVAGLKDRRAVTRQYLSVPARLAERVGAIGMESVRVLRAARHGNKLRTGHLRGNRFSILMRGVAEGAVEGAGAIAERVARLGFPNYYGDQRFGAEEETLRLGWALLRGETSPRDLPPSRREFLLRLALSAVQASLFNRALAERMADGLLHRVLAGDVMEVVASGGKFVAAEVEVEQRRCGAGETAITGPLFGPKMTRAQGEAGERESRLLESAGLSVEDFERFPRLTSGTRRPYLIRVPDLDVAAEAEGLRFRFTLPSGVYATTLLREFQKNDAPGGAPPP